MPENTKISTNVFAGIAIGNQLHCICPTPEYPSQVATMPVKGPVGDDATRMPRAVWVVVVYPESVNERILLMLLEHPGEVVLRADIQQRLWSDNTVVDFDQSINAAVGRLRSALGDSASAPRYIETVSKRGYRFLGEIERIGDVVPEQNGHLPAAATTAPEQPMPSRRRHVSSWVVAVASVTLLLGIAYGVYALRLNRPKAPVMHPVPLTAFPGHAVFAAFSPDGQRVAFSWVVRHRWRVPTSTGGARHPARSSQRHRDRLACANRRQSSVRRTTSVGCP